MDIRLGTQLCVDQFYRGLAPGARYYYLGPWHQSVCSLLIFFRDSGYSRVSNVFIERGEFEKALSLEMLRPCAIQLARPEWMSDVIDVNFSDLEDDRYRNKTTSHEARVQLKLSKIAAAVEDQTKILRSDNPIRALVPYARDAGVHQYRFQSQFFSYILHGADRWVLMPRWFNNGTWDREAKGKKFGRPSLDPRYCFNFPLTRQMRSRIVAFARKSKGKHATFQDLWQTLLREEFKCKLLNKGTDLRALTSDGDGFPSVNQAYRAVIEGLTPEAYAELFGRVRQLRQERRFDLGNFTGQYVCNLEALEADAYFVKEVLRALISDMATTHMVVVRLIDCTTSSVLGVGFSVGGERKEAYRSALYCSVAPRDYIEKLFGLDPGTLARWIARGLSAEFTSDRGAAGWILLIENLDQMFSAKNIAPSREGQSKALVEGSHPRTPRNVDDPTFLQSELTVAGLCKQALIRALADNETSSIADRLSDVAKAEFLAQGRPATPHAFWQYNSEKGRNAGRAHMSHHEAIRAFWEPIKVTLSRRGILHNGQPYRSQELFDSGLMERLGDGQEIEISGYAFPCVIGWLWLEVNGSLIEVERVYGLRLGQDEFAQTSSDLAEAEKREAELKSVTRGAAAAARFEYDQVSKEQTGETLSGATRRKGKRPTGTKVDSAEATVLRQHTGGRRV